MAKNTGNKRVATKHVRDGIKSQYPKGNCCEVCDTDQDLEYHHYHTLSILLKEYSRKNNIPIDTDEQVLAMRDQFYKDNWEAVVTDGATLCATHHKALHKVYGREPALSTAEKQKIWVVRIREKQEGMDSHPSNTEAPSNRFSQYIVRTRVDFASLIKG